MRIAIDAKWFFNGNPSGKVVVYNLINEIVKLDNKHELVIILDKRDKKKLFPFKTKQVELVYVWSRINLISNLFICPFKLLGKKIDIGLFQYFAPPICNFKTVVFILDVIFERSPQFFTWQERLYFKPMKYLASKANAIATISESEAQKITSFGYKSKFSKIGVVTLGVDEKYKPYNNHPKKYLEFVKQKYQLPQNYILYLGRLNTRKNIHTLIKAFSLIKDEKINMVLAGTYDWKMFDVPTLLKEFGIENRVVLTGFVNDEDVSAIYAMAKIFCYISFDEGFGIPPLEAMASGVAVVVSKINVLEEVCGEVGYYVNPNEANSISLTIDEILVDMNNEKQYIKKINIGLERSNMFNWKTSAIKMIDFLEQVQAN